MYNFIFDNIFKEIAGILFIVWAYIDGFKYWIEGHKIATLKSAKGRSRKFILMALGNDLYRVLYFVFVTTDWYVLISTIIALIFMIYMFFMQYKWYPYRMRGCENFHRPNIFLYTINALLPNRIRKRL